MQLIKSLALAALALTTGAKGCSGEGYPALQGYHCKETDKGCYYCSLNSRHIVSYLRPRSAHIRDRVMYRVECSLTFLRSCATATSTSSWPTAKHQLAAGLQAGQLVASTPRQMATKLEARRLTERKLESRAD